MQNGSKNKIKNKIIKIPDMLLDLQLSSCFSSLNFSVNHVYKVIDLIT